MMVSHVSQQSVASIVNANQIMNLVIIVLKHGIYGSYGNFITIPLGRRIRQIRPEPVWCRF